MQPRCLPPQPRHPSCRCDVLIERRRCEDGLIQSVNARSTDQGVSARRIIIGVIVLLTVCVVALVVTGVTSLISLADRLHPIAGSVVFWVVVLTAAFFALY